MRRLAIVGVVALVFAPVARAGCGVTTTALQGKAPLAVTLTAQCTSADYSWDLGDGTTAAVHGYPDVPPYPASHGCARIPMWVAQTVYAQIPDGSAVYVYT